MIQSGITTAVATAVAIFRDAQQVSDLAAWGRSWLLSWILMIPIVLFAAPIIKRLTSLVVRKSEEH
jgi:hypothetical protein